MASHESQVAIDSLIADFNDHPSLPQAVLIIGEQYYNEGLRRENEGLEDESKDNFRKAIAVWERIITQRPESQSIDLKHAYYFSAVCYSRMGEYDKAVEYYQEVVVNWPDYQYACSAQFLIGYIYQDLKNSGTVPGSIADAATTDAYEAVLEKYPDYPAARAAKDWLKYNSRSNEGENK